MTQRVRRPMRGPFAAALALAAAALVTAGCQEPCSPGTVFLEVDLGPGHGADQLVIDVTIGGAHKPLITRGLPAGATSGGFELDFPANGYPKTGTAVTVTVTAKRNGSATGTLTRTFSIQDSCTHQKFDLGPSSSGTGGATGSGGHRGTGGTTGTGGATGTGGRGGAAGGTGGAGGAIGCAFGLAPAGALITDFSTSTGGAPAIPGGGVYTYPMGTTPPPPTATVEAGRWHLKLNAPASGAMNYAGAGIFLSSCVDASLGGYTGVRFTIGGSLSAGCTIQFAPGFSGDSYTGNNDPTASCTLGPGQCYPPSKVFALPALPADVTVNFTDVMGGSPFTVVDTTRLNGFQWQFNVPTNGCVADVTLDNVTFVPHSVSHTFDTSTEGFGLSDYVDPALSNLGAPGSGATPTLALDTADGNPQPGSLKATVHFTNYQQYIDVILPIDEAAPLDLTNRLLHVKVRLTSGVLPLGVVQLHASTTASYIYGTTASSPLTLGQWTDLPLDIRAVTTPGWNASQVLQLGVQIISGFQPSGTPPPYPGSGDVVIHVDTFTD